ncbi:receptor-transporting protein 4 [Kogia breviceps]|uniref:receptor-transporting protein 4 n=1 Tax=Kogia breviceps TaxID=27615 RepID=UPI0027953E7F|nr:receptor-transporting protein 4 [Kogia breviceps]
MDSTPQSKRMVLDVGTWERTFQELIWQEKPQARWTLKMDGNLRPDCAALGWKQYKQRAFGRFWCSSCRRSWASAQVQILFHMYLEHQKSQGKVLVRLFGQRCRKCSQSQFEKPEFSLDSTKRILNNLVQRILERFYRNGIRKVLEIPVIQEVPLEGHHDMVNCEACALGFCIQNLQNCMTEPAKSSPSYMKTGCSSPHLGEVCGQNRARNQSSEAKETQGSGYSCSHKGPGPSHATARMQAPGAGPQLKWEMGRLLTPRADQQAAQGTGPQPIQVAGSLPPGWTDPQPRQAIGPLPKGLARSQSTLGKGPQAPRLTYSQAVKMSGQQLTQDAQATQGTDRQATKVTDPQPTRGTIPRATSRSDTQATRRAGPSPLGSNSQPTRGTGPKATCRIFRESQDTWGRQERCSPRGSAPDSFFRLSPPVLPNDSLNQEQLFRYGCVCVVALFTFLVSKYL